MILKNIKIFCKTFAKIINTILKTQISFNIVFIHLLPSLKNCKEKELVEVSNHPN